MIELHCGDCLKLMKVIPEHSVDMVMCDLPYGTTDCKWDFVIPFEPLWGQYRRVCKKNAAIVLMATQPFTSKLIMSNLDRFKTTWVWNKKQSGGWGTAKWHPLKVTEDICVFSFGVAQYFPIMRTGPARKKGGAKVRSQTQSGLKLRGEGTYGDQYYPVNLLNIVNPRTGNIHPTQKPVALMEYLIRTYTNKGETVLDNCMGSGTTGVACVNTGRNFIGMEKDEGYFRIARDRIERTELLA